MTIAEDLWEIPKIFDAVDMAKTPDGLSIMTYVSYFRDKQAELARARLVDSEQSYAEGDGLTGVGSNVKGRGPLAMVLHAIGENGQPSCSGVGCVVKLTTDNGSVVCIHTYSSQCCIQRHRLLDAHICMERRWRCCPM